jgi:hypothetical protein
MNEKIVLALQKCTKENYETEERVKFILFFRIQNKLCELRKSLTEIEMKVLSLRLTGLYI